MPEDLLAQRYELEDAVDQGGMGTLYRARDRESQETVLVKTIRKSLRTRDRLARRFRLEIAIVELIRHKNIVRILDSGVSSDGTPFFVMPLLAGDDLLTVLRQRGRLSVAHALWLTGQIQEGVDAAHSHHVVHRDLKPGNVFVQYTHAAPDVKILDFGIAKALDPESVNLRHTTMDTTMGRVIGTPRYMAPEQLDGARANTDADLWSVGCILHFVLHRLPPFAGKTAVEVYASIARGDRQRADGLFFHPAVEAVMAQALSMDPAHRFPDAATMRAAVRDAADAICVEPSQCLVPSFDDTEKGTASPSPKDPHEVSTVPDEAGGD